VGAQQIYFRTNTGKAHTDFRFGDLAVKGMPVEGGFAKRVGLKFEQLPGREYLREERLEFISEDG
jgi:hypothetical protein